MVGTKLANAARYLGDKVVDVLMFIFISSVIASIPYLVAPTLTLMPAQVFLSVAVGALIGMVLVFLFAPYVKRAVPKGKPNLILEGSQGLEIYTRTEIEQKFPFEPFISQVKRGGELVFVAATFAIGRGKTETIKRLIREQNVTVALLLLAPFPEGHGTAEIESAFKWEGLTVEIYQTLILLCKLRIELGELKDRLIIRTYDRVPILSLIAIDPSTEDAVMQVGNYLSGTDGSAQFQIIIHKKARKDLFDRYWNEYLLIREYSRLLDYKAIEREFLS
jgi:hypothetical protein